MRKGPQHMMIDSKRTCLWVWMCCSHKSVFETHRKCPIIQSKFGRESHLQALEKSVQALGWQVFNRLDGQAQYFSKHGLMIM